MNRIIAVYDGEPLYAERFAEYINRRNGIPFTVVSFSSISGLRDYLQHQKVDILLIEQGMNDLGELKKQIKQTMILYNGGPSFPVSGCPAIYKYQSSDGIIRELMALYEAHDPVPAIGDGGGNCRIAGIYSPVNRCGKTAFSLIYAQMQAKECRTLYINLEDCAGFSHLFPRGDRGDLSDVIYYFKQHCLDRVKLCSAIHSMGEADYIPPVKYPEDLSEIEPTELAGLLRQLGGIGRYGMLVVDIGAMGRTAAELLEICDVIYMPVLEDGISKAKVEEFKAYLEISQRMIISERIQTVVLPQTRWNHSGDSYLELLLWGEMGDYVRTMIGGRRENWNCQRKSFEAMP